MRQAAVALFVAVVAKSAAQRVSDRRVSSDVEVTRAASVVHERPEMPDCSCCKLEQEKAHKKPRKLERLPLEITQNKTFRRKGLPLMLCAVCDQQAMEAALARHQERLGEV